VPKSELAEFNKCVKKFEELILSEIKVPDPGLKIIAEETEMPKYIINNKTAKKLYKAINAAPHGPLRFIDGMNDVPETSTNLGIVKSENRKIMDE